MEVIVRCCKWISVSLKIFKYVVMNIALKLEFNYYRRKHLMLLRQRSARLSMRRT